ncbi:MAG: caspase family protein, partial [Muribaculaceae bacterium]|nr:caspase family protein [Muribaculaceae bacterium]MDE7393131.1 caspase family protein [Muribaculaceae bacterium]
MKHRLITIPLLVLAFFVIGSNQMWGAKTVKIKLTGTIHEPIQMTVGKAGRSETIRSFPYILEVSKLDLPLKLKFNSESYLYYDIDVPKKPFDTTGHVYLVKVDEMAMGLRNQPSQSAMGNAQSMMAYNEPKQQPLMNAAQQQLNTTSVYNKKTRSSDVDINIPDGNVLNKNTFVLIIANEEYAFVDNVAYALNDGNTFKEYCAKTLGIPERQIWLYENASLGIISSGVNKMVQAMNIFDNSNAIIYYCGHGIPDEKTGDAYIVPVDGKGTDVSSCYSLNRLYKTLAAAKTANVTYFMDACFTGANRDGSMLVAARGVAREAKKEIVEGNTIVFSAASGDETAMPFKEKEHGLFTYFLLKKLQETKGNVTYGELADYINENVKREAFLSNEKPQNPVVATSESFQDGWKNVKMK